MNKCVLRDDRQKKAAFLDGSERALTILERLPIHDSDYDKVHAANSQFKMEECNGVYRWGVVDGHTKVTIIEPCDEQHIKKYSDAAQERQTVIETQELYENVVLKWIEGQARTEWVDNIIEGKAEVEKVVFVDDQVVIVPDYKWRTGNMDDLYLLCLFKDARLRSLRDLRDANMLLSVKKAIERTLKEKYNIDIRAVSVYFHYPPTYYRLHLHIVTNKAVEFTSSHVNLAHSLDTVIYNLTVCGDYYRKADLPILIGPAHPLHGLI